MKPYYQDEYSTIYHGDCREILPQIDAIDFVFTDPPFGHNNNNGDLIANREAALGGAKVEKSEWRPIANDGPEEANELYEYLLNQASRILPPGGCCCCCGGGPDPQFARWTLAMDKLLGFKMLVVWDKGPMGMGWHYRRSWECILVGQKPGAACKWYDETDKIENIIRPGYKGIKKIIPSKNQHPTEKPTQMAGHFIGLHTIPGETVIDPFMGSGTTLRAAKDLGRRAIGIEIEEKYCEMAVRRLRQEVLPL